MILDGESETFRMPMTQVWVREGKAWRCLEGMQDHVGPDIRIQPRSARPTGAGDSLRADWGSLTEMAASDPPVRRHHRREGFAAPAAVPWPRGVQRGGSGDVRSGEGQHLERSEAGGGGR